MPQYNFSPFPELHADRLLLRRLTVEDAPEIFFLRSDESVIKYLDREPATSIQDAKDFIQNIHQTVEAGETILWAIALNSKPGELIGTICFWKIEPKHYRAEIGYALHPQHWRKGIMTEAIEMVLDYGFKVMNLHSVEARISTRNIASASLLEKSSFIKEGHLTVTFFYF